MSGNWYTGWVPERYIRNPNVKCLECKRPIYRRPQEISRNGGRVYCSMKCYGIACRKVKPCIVCNKPILAGLNKKTCNRSCANISRTGIVYKNGRLRDMVVSQRALKIRLLNDRGKECEKCGFDKFQILHVHHKDRNRLNNSLNNLELICPNCHYAEHYLEKSWLNEYQGEVA